MDEPFFIVGCGRSGTTLLRAMLHHHPRLAVPLESMFLVDYLRNARLELPAMARRVLREPEFREWGVSISPRALAGVPSRGALMDRLHRLYARAHGKARWGQKTPRFVRFGSLLQRHFPGARFIHVVRDPRAVTCSLARSDVHWSNAYYGARRWAHDVAAGTAIQSRFPGQTLEISYERLVRAPETVLQEVCAFLGEAYSSHMLQYPFSGGQEYGPYYRRIHAELNRRPDPARIDKWMEELSEREVNLIEHFCGPEMQRRGYAPRTAGRPDRSLVRRLRVRRAGGFVGQVGHSLLWRRPFLAGLVGRKLRLGLWRDLLRLHD